MSSGKNVHRLYYPLLFTPLWAAFFIIPFEIYYNQISYWNYNAFIPLSFSVCGLLLCAVLFTVVRFTGFHRSNHFPKFSFGMFYFGLYTLLTSVFAPIGKTNINTGLIDNSLSNTLIEICLVILIAYLAYKLKQDAKLRIGLLINIALCAVSFSYMILIIMTPKPAPLHLTLKNSHQNRITGNVYHIVLDELQSEAFLRILSEKKAAHIFDGFTLYKNNFSNYLITSASFNSFITGSIYRQGDYMQWRKKFQSEGLLRDLKLKGYRLSMYTPWDHWFHNSFTMEFREMDSFIKDQRYHFIRSLNNFTQMCIARLLPELLAQKFLSLNNPNFFAHGVLNSHLPNNWDEGACTYASVQMFKQLIEMEKERHSDGEYVYIHALLPHNPYVYREDGRYDKTLLQKTKWGYYSQVAFSVRLLNSYLNELKRLNRYDKSTIIIQSDHGAAIWYNGSDKELIGLDKMRKRTAGSLLGNTQGWNNIQVISRAKSLLMIKPAHTKTPLEISLKPIQLIDVYPTMVSLLKLDNTAKNDSEGISLIESPVSRRKADIYIFLPNPFSHDNPSKIVELELLDPANYQASGLTVGKTIKN